MAYTPIEQLTIMFICGLVTGGIIMYCIQIARNYIRALERAARKNKTGGKRR